MTPITSLVLPILVAAVAVFVLSVMVQTMMPWHKRDFDNVPDDAAVLNAIRQLNIAPGDYTVPSPRLATLDLVSPQVVDSVQVYVRRDPVRPDDRTGVQLDVAEDVARLDIRFTPSFHSAGSPRWRSDMGTPAKNTICLWYDRDAEDA